MTSSIYARKGTVLIVGIFTTIFLVGTTIGFIVWFNYDKNYGFGEIVIHKDQDFVNRYDFPGSGTINDPYLIANYNIDTNKEVAIFIEETTKYFLITNCTIKCPYNGIIIRYVTEGTARIENNEIQTSANTYAYESAIQVFWAPGSQIINNQLSFLSSNYYTYGIFVSSSMNSWIANNSCDSFGVGIYVTYSDSALIEYNFVEICESGIYIDSCDNSITRYNSLYFNEFAGVSNYKSINCIFHHNNFLNNSNSYYSYQAGDSSANIWYDTSSNEGNYWSDLVWDDSATYEIEGSGECIDLYPLQFPVVI
jgi:parallel beta-helix repeat protein